MLKLHGFSFSNYYNVVKLTLLEKGIEFEEALVYSGAGPKYRPDYLSMSPQGKIPCLQTEQGFLTESRCIIDYIEAVYPTPPLFPSDPFGRAKVSELTHVIDLYLELPARRLIRNFFGRSKPPNSVADEVKGTLERAVETLRRLGRFDPFITGDVFNAADVSAVIHFPVVRMLSKTVLDSDPFAALPGVEQYLARLEERPAVQHVRKDQRENFPHFVAHLQWLYGGAP